MKTLQTLPGHTERPGWNRRIINKREALMYFKRYSTLGMVLMVSAGLIFIGCAKKETAVSAAAGKGAKPGVTAVTSGASGTRKPSSHSVYFAFDDSSLDAAARGILDANAAWLKANSGLRIVIEANCDERGSREYNLALGQRRADSVRNYFAAHGVAARRIETVSFGEERPVCKGSGEACWAQNRRADIVTR